ncbi:MAG: hypothetical protein IT335_02530 [Thermomicrobiales bacterium]|jgi:isopenicillin-N N-acyltransferase-like protein|nr:hypothetical protein [Thermomicrobiales bacterium]
MIDLIETGGTPFDIGHDVGSAQREVIRQALSDTHALFAEAGDPAAFDRTGPFAEAIERHAPPVAAEMRGMAAGSGLTYEEIVFINATAELDLDAGRHTACTVAGISGHGTADGHVLVAHNEDETAALDKTTYLVKAEPDGAPAFVAFTYAGLMLHQGVNAAGIASVGNALNAPDATPGGVPKLIQYRRALAATTIEGAIRAVTIPERGFGNNHLLATADGDIYDLEVSGADWRMMPAGNRFLVHANHFTHPDLAPLDTGDDLLNSRLREQRLHNLIDAAFGTITPDSLRATMSDHANYPKSICKHATPDSDLDYGTIGSVVIDVTTRTLWACAGNPCRSEWRKAGL